MATAFRDFDALSGATGYNCDLAKATADPCGQFRGRRTEQPTVFIGPDTSRIAMHGGEQQHRSEPFEAARQTFSGIAVACVGCDLGAGVVRRNDRPAAAATAARDCGRRRRTDPESVVAVSRRDQVTGSGEGQPEFCGARGSARWWCKLGHGNPVKGSRGNSLQ